MPGATLASSQPRIQGEEKWLRATFPLPVHRVCTMCGLAGSEDLSPRFLNGALKLKSERKRNMKSKKCRQELKGEIIKKKKEGNRMGGIGKCEAELVFSNLKER